MRIILQGFTCSHIFHYLVILLVLLACFPYRISIHVELLYDFSTLTIHLWFQILSFCLCVLKSTHLILCSKWKLLLSEYFKAHIASQFCTWEVVALCFSGDHLNKQPSLTTEDTQMLFESKTFFLSTAGGYSDQSLIAVFAFLCQCFVLEGSVKKKKKNHLGWFHLCFFPCFFSLISEEVFHLP